MAAVAHSAAPHNGHPVYWIWITSPPAVFDNVCCCSAVYFQSILIDILRNTERRDTIDGTPVSRSDAQCSARDEPE